MKQVAVIIAGLIFVVVGSVVGTMAVYAEPDSSTETLLSVGGLLLGAGGAIAVLVGIIAAGVRLARR